jgi:hypothetical protein
MASGRALFAGGHGAGAIYSIALGFAFAATEIRIGGPSWNIPLASAARARCPWPALRLSSELKEVVNRFR